MTGERVLPKERVGGRRRGRAVYIGVSGEIRRRRTRKNKRNSGIDDVEKGACYGKFWKFWKVALFFFESCLVFFPSVWRAGSFGTSWCTRVLEAAPAGRC